MYRSRKRKQKQNEGQRKSILICPNVDDPWGSWMDGEPVKFECILFVDSLNAFCSSTQKNSKNESNLLKMVEFIFSTFSNIIDNRKFFTRNEYNSRKLTNVCPFFLY